MYIILLLILFGLSLMWNFTRDWYKSLWYCFKTPKDLWSEFFGLICFSGYYGSGKSLSMSNEGLRLRKLAEKTNKKLYVASNYGFNGEDFKIQTYKDLQFLCDWKKAKVEDGEDSYLLILIDELQNC